MNNLKQHLDNSLAELTLAPQLTAEILLKAEVPVKKRRRYSRAATILLAVVCLVGITAVGVIYSGWLTRDLGWMTREEFAARFPDSPSLNSWTEGERRYVVLSELQVEPYDGLTDEQLDKLTEVLHNGHNAILPDAGTAHKEYGLPLLQSETLVPEGEAELHVAGLDSPTQISLDYTLYNTLSGKNIFVYQQLTPPSGAQNSFTRTAFSDKECTVVSYHIESLDTDATLSYTDGRRTVDVMFTIENVAYTLHIVLATSLTPVESASRILERLELTR